MSDETSMSVSDAAQQAKQHPDDAFGATQTLFDYRDRLKRTRLQSKQHQYDEHQHRYTQPMDASPRIKNRGHPTPERRPHRPLNKERTDC
ncbi:hypothetical protein [Halocatena pleomorpha]|uniref:Uncharacterized protein n=1 Tax=Halocatena pleomorpha TaxID=1785090 RepID=A0A3P3RLJ7_9EURY|nr:hypothetical protein [Halocatena pleomorpha]RRJ33730.1 hypothetical protein EIK79_02760 [Halocatena pleomorpha]